MECAILLVKRGVLEKMDIRVLKYFLAVAREQSFSVAAERLYLSQPTLSRQLKELEDELGKPLLVRSNKGGNCLLRSNTPLKGKGLKKTKETNLYTLSTKAGVAYTIQGL